MKKMIIFLVLLLLLNVSGCSKENNIDQTGVDVDQNNNGNAKGENHYSIYDDTYSRKMLNDDIPYYVKGQLDPEIVILTTVNYRGSHYLVKFDGNGDAIWFDNPTLATPSEGNNKVLFKHTQKEGLYQFIEGKNDMAYDSPNGDLYVFNNKGLRIQLNADAITYKIDPHDALVFDENHYIVSTWETQTIDEIGEKRVTKIQEISNGALLWEFNSADYPELFNSRYTDGDNPSSLARESDYIHINSMCVDPKDGNLLVSFRNQCSIIKINRYDGRIMWIMGGMLNEFNIPEECLFFYQHSISFTDEGHLLMFDNGKVGGDSRILELEIDEYNKTVYPANILNLTFYTASFGNVVKIQDYVYLVSVGQPSSREIGINAYNVWTNEIMFELKFDRQAASYWVSYEINKNNTYSENTEDDYDYQIDIPEDDLNYQLEIPADDASYQQEGEDITQQDEQNG